MDNIYAHLSKTEKQPLNTHLVNVASLAMEFARQFKNEDWLQFSGSYHDLGKAFVSWQQYLLEGNPTSIKHSEAGTYLAYKRFQEDPFWKKLSPFQKVISYLISGHHAGLPDYFEGSGNSLKSILENEMLIKDCQEILKKEDLSIILKTELPRTFPFNLKTISKDFMNDFHLWIRMLYSCLVDADFLDTEAFMTPEDTKRRGQYEDLKELKKRFDLYMEQKTKNAADSKINIIRKRIQKACVEKSKLGTGFYSLNVPTGGGKTLASMSFALNHAVLHNKKRIITAIPYTSIIEQTANVFKYGTDDIEQIELMKKSGTCLFGEDNVLEHHSNFDFDKDENVEILKKHKLASENWDAPIVVTTNVQLFESLFNAHSSHCRKLHNIVDSVIILDEVQMLPPEFLKSILSVLQSLVKNYGVTVVLCTATQPAITGNIGSNCAMFEGIPENLITPIIENPEELSKELKRVEIKTDFVKEKLSTWKEVADKLKDYEQVLCIVQTRKDCRELHSLMPEGTIHLSALMCAEERSEVISQIKKKLKDREPVRVISTQLVECGVDIDFPVVFKALSGFDSIAQAAGRCNREGKIKEFGNVFVFDTPSRVTAGLLRKGAEATKDLLEINNYKIELTSTIFKQYFTNYYSRVNNFDLPEFENTMLKNAATGEFQFRTLSDNYHLIDNSYQGTVYVHYKSDLTGKDNLELLEQLINSDITKGLFRKLTRYSVNLPVKEIDELVKSGRVEKIQLGNSLVYVQNLNDENLYQKGLGLVADSLKSFNTYIF